MKCIYRLPVDVIDTRLVFHGVVGGQSFLDVLEQFHVIIFGPIWKDFGIFEDYGDILVMSLFVIPSLRLTRIFQTFLV